MRDADATDTQPDRTTQSDDADARRKAMTSDDFLVPGPTPTSNEGLGRWGLSWLIFSVVLILLMLGISWVCWLLATATGIA